MSGVLGGLGTVPMSENVDYIASYHCMAKLLYGLRVFPKYKLISSKSRNMKKLICSSLVVIGFVACQSMKVQALPLTAITQHSLQTLDPPFPDPNSPDPPARVSLDPPFPDPNSPDPPAGVSFDPPFPDPNSPDPPARVSFDPPFPDPNSPDPPARVSLDPPFPDPNSPDPPNAF